MTSLKTYLCSVVLIVGLLLTTGCSKPEPIYVQGLQLSTHSLGFDSHGGEHSVSVVPYPDDVRWELQCDEYAWLSVRAETDGVIVVAEANYDSKERKASFSIISPDALFEPCTIIVAQEAATELQFSCNAPEEYVFDSEGGSRTFTVESNYAWSVTTTHDWITVQQDDNSHRVSIVVERNTTDTTLSGDVTISVGKGSQNVERVINVKQTTRADNPYYKLVGEWEIVASKWFYSPNGSLNSLDYAPNPSDYYLLFDIEEKEYNKSLVMRNFLYPDTALEVEYDSSTGGFVIPFGWTVLGYDVFLYVTMVATSSFSYASLEVPVTPNSDYSALIPDMPSVDGFNYVGFGLWTYDDSGNKVAFGSKYRPTMFPMNEIRFNRR